jgi:hypothetical protein
MYSLRQRETAARPIEGIWSALVSPVVKSQPRISVKVTVPRNELIMRVSDT